MNDMLKKIPSVKLGPKKGIAVMLGDETHFIAPYTLSGGRPTLEVSETKDSASLKELSRKAPGMSICFSSRGIYSDVGDFSSVSREATMAHIRSAIDKLGLFKDDYQVSFAKIQDIDDLKGRYSYLAVPSNELVRTEFIDEEEALVDMFCPIEASIASAVGFLDDDMVVVVYEDTRFVRIIGTKSGIIYYLITVNHAESFDARADTVSGIREMTSMLQSSGQEKVRKIYCMGRGDIDISDLEKYDIQTVPFCMGESGDQDPGKTVLYGTALGTRYDFTPQRLLRTKRIVGYAKISCAVSVVMLLISVCLFALGWGNSLKARALETRTNSALYQSAQQLKDLEDEYNSLSRNLDLTNINSIIDTYKNFQAEPKLQIIVQTITGNVPANVFITRIEVNRPSSQEGMPQERVVQTEENTGRTSQAKPFFVMINGIINLGYPASKTVFSSFIASLQKEFTVSKASYSHKEQLAEFSLHCEMKP